MAATTTAMLARRPHKTGMAPFGHVDLAEGAREHLEPVVQGIASSLLAKQQVPFHPDDEPEPGEVLVAPLKGFDAWFQPNAPWSLERVAEELRSLALPAPISATDIRDGGWTFYAIRIPFKNTDAILVRAKSPSFGLKSAGKLVTRVVGGELRPLTEPLLAFDHVADLVVVAQRVLVVDPRKVERLLVDAEAVKARAPETAAGFEAALGAKLTPATRGAIERVCSHNANVARRVERLIRDETLGNVTAAAVRAALPSAGLSPTDFGKGGPLSAGTDQHATVLVDVVADLYYQPQFDAAPRRVAVYRKL